MNVGNTCYLNTAIQCLFHHTELLDKILLSSSNNDNNLLVCGLANLLDQIWNRNEIGIPRQLISISRKLFKDRMEILVQNDMEEFIHAVIETITRELGNHVDESLISAVQRQHDDERDAKQKLVLSMRLAWLKTHSKEYSDIVELLYGQQITQSTCNNCKTFNHNYEVFTVIPLSFSTKQTNEVISIQSLLDLHMTPEEISGWKCDKCNQQTSCRKATKLWRLPNLLIFVLKRFNSTCTFTKIKTRVNVPLELSLDPYTIYDNHTSYKLLSLGCHYGNLQSGHYYAVCRHPNQQWYKYDDDCVQEMCEKNMEDLSNSSDVYVVCYERM